MAGTTSVPQPLFGPNGFVAPATSAILAGVQTDMNAAFGGNLNPGLTTPQGQLASSFTAIIDDCDANFCFITNQFDPALNSGRWQDGIGYIYFMTRIPAEATAGPAVCTGKVGVVIPAGSLAVAVDGNIYASTNSGTIGASGTATITFQCQTTGPIPCPADTLTGIYQAIPGWDSINNTSALVTGQNVETPQAFELRRAQSVALNSIGPAPAVLGAVLATTGVTDAYVYDNSSSSPVTIQGQTIAANSLYCCVSGGTNAAVAHAIWTRKAPGCAYTGSTSVTVQDTNSGYVSPFPSYTVQFQRPTSLSIFYAISIKSSAAVPANATALIQQAVANAFNGISSSGSNTPNTRARIGGTIFALACIGNIVALGAWAQVISAAIGSANSSAATASGSISGTTLTVTGVTGTIAIGQGVQGTGVLPGTQIVSGSGSSWVVSLSQTLASTSLTFIAPSLADLTVNINQQPVFSSADAFVTYV